MPKIDYRLRPSKAIQRHMIIDICRRLSSFAPLNQYQYVGFGGLDFVDFALAHRSLGVNHMVSIEANTVQIERFRFNRPFSSIRIVPGRASEHLADLDWGKLSIVWLDYEQMLNYEVISDVKLLCGRLQPGSALFVTVNALSEKRLDGRREELVRRIGESRVPSNVTDDSLGLWGLADVQRQVLSDVITAALRDRAVSSSWYQVLDIRYADDSKMQTLGGIAVGPGNKTAFDACRFDELEFARFAGSEPVYIRVPVLTAKERRALDEQLPLAPSANLSAPWLDPTDAEDYLQVYRYYTPGQVIAQ
jgi:hypothetical protein